MANFSEKVLERRQALGLSQSELGKAAGLSYQAIQQIEEGRSKSTRRLVPLARALKVTPEWLTSDEDHAPPAAPFTVSPVPATSAAPGELYVHQMPRDLQVLGGALCGEDGLFEFNGQALDHVRRPPRLLGIKDAYAVYINGDCMSPWREHGDLVYVHPHVPAKINDYVVVQLRPEIEGGAMPAYIKRLVRRTAANLLLVQYNPRKELTIPTRRIAAVHRIIDWSELMGI